MKAVSVCIPYYIVDAETEAMTLECIDAFKKTMSVTDELILIDDCSPYKHSVPFNKRHGTNAGNAAAWNSCIQIATKDILLLSDNDIIPVLWREPLIKGLDSYAIVFPIVYNLKIGAYQEHLAGEFFMFKRDLVDKIGYFDEEYGSYFEDTDFFKRTMKAGGDLAVIPKTHVIHKSQGTFSKIRTAEELEQLFKRNQKRYESKFGENYPYLI